MRFLLLMIVATIAAAEPDPPSMHQAAEAGDLNALAKLLAQDGALDMLYTPNRDGGTPLHVAAFGGHARFVEHALQFVSRTAGDQETTKLVRTESFKRSTALHKAARGDSVGTARLLLDAGALPDAKNSRNLTPILLAATVDASDVASLLLLYGADPLQRDVNGLSIGELAEQHGHKQFRERTWPLHADAARGDGAKVAAHLKAGVKVNAVDDRGDTAIRVAANWGHADIVGTLERAGAVADVFVVIAMDRKDELEKILSANPSAISMRDAFGFVPIHWAVRHRRLEMIPALASPETLNAVTDERQKPLDLAIHFKFSDVAKALASAGANIDERGHAGRTRLHKAASRDDAEAVAFLLSVGADIDAQDSVGRTPLHHALEQQNGDVVTMLISGGADVNTASYSGDGPLHIAAKLSLDLTKQLIHNGAEPNAVDSDGNTPLFRVIDSPLDQRVAIAKALIEGGASAGAINNAGDGVLDTLYANNENEPTKSQALAELFSHHGAEYQRWHGPAAIRNWSHGKVLAASGLSMTDDEAYLLFVHWLNASSGGRTAGDKQIHYDPLADATYGLWRAFRNELFRGGWATKNVKNEEGKKLAAKRRRILNRYTRDERYKVYALIQQQFEKHGSLIPDFVRELGYDGTDAPFGWQRGLVDFVCGENLRDEIAYITFVSWIHGRLFTAGVLDYQKRYAHFDLKTLEQWHKFRRLRGVKDRLFRSSEPRDGRMPNDWRARAINAYDGRYRAKLRRFLAKHEPAE